jgi:hypothetical protein
VSTQQDGYLRIAGKKKIFFCLLHNFVGRVFLGEKRGFFWVSHKCASIAFGHFLGILTLLLFVHDARRKITILGHFEKCNFEPRLSN